ncbi:MAG: DivIVA domain-containing protein [Propionibacteriaceae bacterium]|nr:DivIVA domain-containing protein [Propionibacteriaceae bacterium]
MALTLDEVRKTRFHMSRRNGYEVTDVDMFVDKVEEALGKLSAEIDSLKKDGGTGGSVNTKELENLKFQLGRLQEDKSNYKTHLARMQSDLDQARAQAQAGAGDEAILREVEQLRRQLADTRGQLAESRAQLADSARTPVNQEQLMRLTAENTQLREQLERFLASATDTNGESVPIAVTTSPEASSAVVRLVQLATEQADNLVTEATTEAEKRKIFLEEEIRKLEEQSHGYVARAHAEADAHALQVRTDAQSAAEELLRKATESSAQLTTDAQQRAERLEQEAQVNAEKLVREAQQRATLIDTEIASRRAEVFGELESEREGLNAKVEKLRAYEKTYRQTMTGYLMSQIERLDSSQFANEEATAEQS